MLLGFRSVLAAQPASYVASLMISSKTSRRKGLAYPTDYRTLARVHGRYREDLR